MMRNGNGFLKYLGNLSCGVDSYEQPSKDLQTIKFRKNTIQVSTKTLALKNKIIVMLCGK